MAILDILHYPDPRLRTLAKPVATVDDGIRQLVKDMFETMYAAPGIGLAATQVDVHQRVLVLDVSEGRSQPLCLINPVIVAAEGSEQMEEGCLSVPDVFEAVERAERVVVHALDEKGNAIKVTAEGLLAVCIQHEIDHLDGRLFVDRLSALKRSRIRKKFDKQQRQVV
ncbi:MAG: peptide deformylase [Gammaproteobacteria bacterium]|nr:peptide deformylase [Gammaproteobacteria bacterium]MBI5617846.1 peptide deformylase [Gammaproteobacteria bacterium]